jgi:hypothetical protein
MTIGIEDRRMVAVAAALLVAAVIFAGRWVIRGSGVTGGEMRSPSLHAGGAPVAVALEASMDPALRLGLLRETEETIYLGGGRNIFRVVEAPSRIEAFPKSEQKHLELPRLAEHPAIPLSFFGFSRKGGVRTAFLLKGEDVFLAREGDIVDRRYRIVRVRPAAVDVEDLLGERSEELVLPQR